MRDWRGLCLLLMLFFCTGCQCNARLSEDEIAIISTEKMQEMSKRENEKKLTETTEAVKLDLPTEQLSTEFQSESVAESETGLQTESSDEREDGREVVHIMDMEMIQYVANGGLNLDSPILDKKRGMGFVAYELCYDWSIWYREYNGEKLQRLINDKTEDYGSGGLVEARYDIIYYREDEGETPGSAAKKMLTATIEPLKQPDLTGDRGFVVIDYEVGEQNLCELSDGLWAIITANVSYTLDRGGSIADKGMPGSYTFLLMYEDGVYRLQQMHHLSDYLVYLKTFSEKG